MTILKVSSSSGPNMVAGAIAGAVRECGRAELHAVGAGATNQAVKAIAIASSFFREEGMMLLCQPDFIEVKIGEVDRTAIRLRVRMVPLEEEPETPEVSE